MRAVLAVLLLSLAACQIVYKLPTRQGNVIDQKDLDKVTLGMTREQVRFILGTPIASNGLRADRWDYYGYYKPPRGEGTSRTVSLFFDGDRLVRMEGDEGTGKGAVPDLKTIEAEQKKAEVEKERAEEQKKDGGIITPPDQQDHKNGGGGAGAG